MALTVGTRLGVYEVVALIGVGGMSACGHAEPRPSGAEARHLRQSAAGVGPRRQVRK